MRIGVQPLQDEQLEVEQLHQTAADCVADTLRRSSREKRVEVRSGYLSHRQDSIRGVPAKHARNGDHCRSAEMPIFSERSRKASVCCLPSDVSCSQYINTPR